MNGLKIVACRQNERYFFAGYRRESTFCLFLVLIPSTQAFSLIYAAVAKREPVFALLEVTKIIFKSAPQALAILVKSVIPYLS